MTDNPEFVPGQKHTRYRHVVSDDDGGGRLMFQPHWIQEEEGARIVHPSLGMAVSEMVREDDPNSRVVVIRLDHVYGPTSLAYVPTMEELRAAGQEMLRLADEHEAAAADMLAAALGKGKAS